MRPWYGPSSQRSWRMKVPSRPTYVSVRIVPDRVAIVEPGSGNCTLRITNAAITTATNVIRGQARADTGAIGSYDAGRPDQPDSAPIGSIRCGSQLATTRAIVPPKAVFPEGRTPVAPRRSTNSC